MMDFERLVLIGALAAAVTVGGALNARVKDLVQQRDISKVGPPTGSRTPSTGRPRRRRQKLRSQISRDLEAAQTGPAGFSAVYLGEFNCTAYCSEQYEHICGTGDGITASGAPVQAGVTVAADPDILPLGSAVYIEGVGLRYIQDTGSAVKGKALDVAVDTHSEALTWSGYGTHRVWLLEVE